MSVLLIVLSYLVTAIVGGFCTIGFIMGFTAKLGNYFAEREVKNGEADEATEAFMLAKESGVMEYFSRLPMYGAGEYVGNWIADKIEQNK